MLVRLQRAMLMCAFCLTQNCRTCAKGYGGEEIEGANPSAEYWYCALLFVFLPFILMTSCS